MSIEYYKQELERLIERVDNSRNTIEAMTIIDEIRIVMSIINRLEKASCC